MAAALPWYRRAVREGTRAAGRSRDRLAVRFAWAAHLGGGGAEDLRLAEGFAEGGAKEALPVVAEAWLRPATWRPERAVALLAAAPRTAAVEYFARLGPSLFGRRAGR